MVRKLILGLLILLIISSCGLSSKDKDEIATITCNILSESRMMDAAFRIQEINKARETLGEDRFLLGDTLIVQAISFDLCKELVLNNPNFIEILEKKKDSVNAEIKRVQDSTLLALVENRKKEEERLAKLREQRIQQQEENRKRQEENRISYTNEKKASQREWRNQVEKYVNQIEIASVRFVEYRSDIERLIFGFKCNNDIKGFGNITIKFRGGLEDINTGDGYFCSESVGFDRSYLTDEHIEALDKVANNPISIIESVSMELNSVYMIKGSDYSTSATPYRVYFPQHYKHLSELERLENPIIYKLNL